MGLIEKIEIVKGSKSCVENQVDCEDKKKQNKDFFVFLTHTVVNPRAMMIEFLSIPYLDAPLTMLTVPSCFDFLAFAIWANIVSFILFVHFRDIHADFNKAWILTPSEDKRNP